MDALFLRLVVERKVDVLIWKLNELNESTKKRHHFDATTRSARAYFDIVLEDTGLCQSF